MTEPLYAIGQHVAVCNISLTTVIPATTVVERAYTTKSEIRVHARTGERLPPREGWVYRVAGGRTALCGRPSWYWEESLRPINPDSEYLESPSHLEVPA